MRTSIAYCYRSGHIKFTLKSIIPEGAIRIASAPYHRLRAAVMVNARMSYPTVRGGDDEVPLVPGIPEADSEDHAFDALSNFCSRVKQSLGR